MASLYLLKQLHGIKLSRVKNKGAMNVRVVSYHNVKWDAEACVDDGNQRFSPEWYDKAFLKLKKWSYMLKNLDMIDGKLVDVSDNTRVFDDELTEKMHMFKSVARIVIGHPSVLDSMRNNVMSALHDDYPKREPPFFFGRSIERQPMIVDTLTKVSNYLVVSALQRKVMETIIFPKVAHFQIWISAFEEILNQLKSEIDVVHDDCLSKRVRLAKQIISSCLKMLESVNSYDPESTSELSLQPEKASPCKWEDLVPFINDLTNCLGEEKDFLIHVEKVEAMKEGLYEISDFLIGKKKHKKHLAQRKLTKKLGHTSKCLYTLLSYYLLGTVNDLEVEVCGTVYPRYPGDRFYLCMGKILTSTEEKVVESGMKQLDRTLKLFKFVWVISGMKGELEVQGHLWCVGANYKLLSYRGNPYILHGLNR